jgi:CelD/BcsL family acetyltransferase involved in cellulose biosynthesis
MSAVEPRARHHAESSRAASDSASKPLLGEVKLEIHYELPEIEREWRQFEQVAEATAFQSFAWLASWHRYVGSRQGVQPVIVIGRDAGGSVLFLLPLATRAMGFARQLTWLGSELCDYNAPLLARGISERMNAMSFVLLWERILRRLRGEPHLQIDLINLEKMPALVGEQRNPMCWLPLSPHRSAAYLTQLGSEWTAFYKGKRSSSTRARDLPSAASFRKSARCGR